MNEPKSLGGRVLQARLNLAAKRGRTVTQQEVADKMKVTGVTIGRWESDQKEPDLATIERLAQVLETSAPWLAFGVEVPRSDMSDPEVPQNDRPVNPSPSTHPLRDQAKPAKRRKAGGT